MVKVNAENNTLIVRECSPTNLGAVLALHYRHHAGRADGEHNGRSTGNSGVFAVVILEDMRQLPDK